MKKILILVLGIVILIAGYGCSEVDNEVNETPSEEVVSELSDEEVEPSGEVEKSDEVVVIEGVIKHTFISGDEAVEILASDDDYTEKLSIYDYNSKFQSETALDADGRREILKDHVLEWNDDQKAVIDQAMTHINELFMTFEIDMPDVQFILTSDIDEGGAAYTRGRAIILKLNKFFNQ